jgi:hypothetical protein
MLHRSFVGAFALIGVLAPLTSCSNNPELNSITIDPASITASDSAGLYTDFIAIGSYTRPGHTAITKDITDQVTWSSANPQIVSINSSTGVATVTGEGYGDLAIYASAPGFHGDVVGSAAFTVSAPSSSASRGAITSLSITQDSKTAVSTNATVQFTAKGKAADGSLVNLEGQPKWTSTDSEVASIDADNGIVSTLGEGRSTIVAVYTNPDGTKAVGATHLYVAPKY